VNTSSEQQKLELLQQIGHSLDSRLSTRKTEIAKRYLAYYFHRVPMEELGQENPEVLARLVENQLKFFGRRLPGETLIRVFNPEKRRNGWESEHTIIEMANDDKPFIVDSATLALSEMNLDVRLIVHPVIRVRRDRYGRMLAITGKDDKSAIAESVVQIQINRQTREEVLA